MADSTSSRSGLRRWHGRLEHYTPDGAFGRVLLAAVAGPVAVSALSLAILGFSSLSFAGFLAGLVGAGVGLPAAVLTVVTLWPVYLSLIGNLESASAYPEDSPVRSSSDPDDPEAVLKRQYARGSISQEEFERRLDGLFGVEADRSRREGFDDRRNLDAAPERERN